MNSSSRDLPATSDPLGETLYHLRLNGSLYCHSELTGRWNIDIPAMTDKMMFHIVLSGQLWLRLDKQPARQLSAGDLVLLPHGQGHRLFSDETAPAEALFDIPVHQVSKRYEVLKYHQPASDITSEPRDVITSVSADSENSNAAETTELICGVISIDHAASRQFVAQLPALVLLLSDQQELSNPRSDSLQWIQTTVPLIIEEARTLRPGGETILTHLADILVIKTIRSWLDAAPDAQKGWLAALKDKQIGSALASIHKDPDKPWTVESLAREAGMSRSGFSARFTDLVGDSVKSYLTQWRMQLARSRLLQSNIPIAVLAEELGYSSEAAFSRAFKRIIGIPPGQVRH
ncbi:AraC family transcriptional regulator [Oceanospirillum sediminis]|uniref:AraC family transcriptional regulator n=1 Tax=Oceanospirillum sediminis TaxID=2760088 RepID=A0A839ITY3_9GAMM|nr:AraC family transcriptional regulator [Oceanospirillum sediminis]MBB1488140.1 AraC family transcriptional regulator [Oceanospirillum sediminis]